MDKLVALIQKTPVAHKLFVLLFLIGACGAGHYFLIYTDQEKELKKLDKKLGVLETELQEKQEIAGNLSKFRKRVEFLQQKLEEKKKNLPDTANLDQLLKTLNELSEKSDLRIIKFQPLPEQRKNFYAEIPVKMEIEGNYHEIATFFDKVSKEERIINISKISLMDPEMKNGKMVLKGVCTAKTFKSVPKKAKAVAGAKKKKKKKRKKSGGGH